VGGLKDLEARVVRSIGDSNIRFREDPVRMVRAVRFASRLGFTIEPQTRHAILEHHGEILKAAPSRMLEEIYRLFSFHSGEAAFRLLRETRLMSVLFPEIDIYVDENGQDASLVWKCLGALDDGKSGVPEPTPALMWGSLYYPLFLKRVQDLRNAGRQATCWEVAEELLKPVARRFQMPKAVFFELVHALDMQRRLAQDPARQPSFDQASRQRFSPHRFMANPAFRSALALYRIYVAAGAGDPRALHGWLQLREQYRDAGPREGTMPQRHEPHRPEAHGQASPQDHRRPPRHRRWHGGHRDHGSHPRASVPAANG